MADNGAALSLRVVPCDAGVLYGQLGNNLDGYYMRPQDVVGSPLVSIFEDGFEGQSARALNKSGYDLALAIISRTMCL